MTATAGRFTGTTHGFRLTASPPPLRLLFADMWHSRRLVALLSKQSFFTRYRRAAFGLAWAVALPLIQAVVMAAIFHFALRLRTPHYPVFLFAGMFPWSFFNGAVTAGSTAIVDNSGLSSKIYFPRILLPIIAVTSNGYNLAITVVVLVVAAAGLGVYPGVHTLLLLPAAALTVLVAIAICAVLSALHVYFRDVRYIVIAATTAWFYLTPIFYPLSFLTERHAPAALTWIVRANPATGLVEFFRAGVVGADPTWGFEVMVSCAWLVALSGLALWLHRRYDRLFADLL